MQNAPFVLTNLFCVLTLSAHLLEAQEAPKSSYTASVKILQELKGKPHLEVSGSVLLPDRWKHLQQNNNSVSGSFEGKSESSDLWKSILIFLKKQDYESWTGPKPESVASSEVICLKVKADNKEHRIQMIGSRIFRIDDELFMGPEGGMICWEFFIDVMLKNPAEWSYVK